MLEKYYKYKVNYKDYVIFLKFGNFYEIIDNDSFIINDIFGLKLNKLSSTFKCGVPVNSISKYCSKLDELNINYILIDEDISDCKEFDDNTYNHYKYDINTFKYNSYRINNICNYLNNNIHRNISNILDRSEGILSE